MTAKRCITVVRRFSILLAFPPTAFSQPAQTAIVRLAELAIDPAHLDIYKAALKEVIATSIRIEPGVLTL